MKYKRLCSNNVCSDKVNTHLLREAQNSAEYGRPGLPSDSTLIRKDYIYYKAEENLLTVWNKTSNPDLHSSSIEITTKYFN